MSERRRKDSQHPAVLDQGSFRKPVRHHVVEVFGCDSAEGVLRGLRLDDPIKLSLRRWIAAGAKQPSRVVTFLARGRKCHLRIRAERDQFFSSSKAIFEPPQLATAWLHEHVQSAAVAQLERLLPRL